MCESALVREWESRSVCELVTACVSECMCIFVVNDCAWVSVCVSVRVWVCESEWAWEIECEWVIEWLCVKYWASERLYDCVRATKRVWAYVWVWVWVSVWMCVCVWVNDRVFVLVSDSLSLIYWVTVCVSRVCLSDCELARVLLSERLFVIVWLSQWFSDCVSYWLRESGWMSELEWVCVCDCIFVSECVSVWVSVCVIVNEWVCVSDWAYERVHNYVYDSYTGSQWVIDSVCVRVSETLALS
jgi:hypothetical protein